MRAVSLFSEKAAIIFDIEQLSSNVFTFLFYKFISSFIVKENSAQISYTIS
jgi:hypothetical protein